MRLQVVIEEELLVGSEVFHADLVVKKFESCFEGAWMKEGKQLDIGYIGRIFLKTKLEQEDPLFKINSWLVK